MDDLRISVKDALVLLEFIKRPEVKLWSISYH